MNGNEIALCPWLIWSDSNATHLLLFISTLCAITHHSCASILYLCQLFRVAHASDLPLLFNLNAQIQMQKNANASILTYVCRLNVQIQMQKRYASTRTCVCGSNVQIQMQKKRYASNLCLQIKCSNAADQGVHILHRALHQAIISFSNLIKLKMLWSKTYVVIIVSVFKVGWKVRCWKVCSITILSWTGFAWSKVH